MSFEEIRYPFYKVLHLSSIMVMLSGLGISFFGVQSRTIKILTGIATFLTLVGGMGLMKALGISHGEPWPLWINLKFAIWLVVGIGGAVIARRFPKYGRPAYFLFIVMFVAAATIANLKFE
jgi:hypothetical protein